MSHDTYKCICTYIILIYLYGYVLVTNGKSRRYRSLADHKNILIKRLDDVGAPHKADSSSGTSRCYLFDEYASTIRR